MPVPGAPNAGFTNDVDVMDWTTVSARFTNWRGYLNGAIVAGDIVAASLTRENLYRPDQLPFPAAGIFAQTQACYRYNERIRQPHAVDLNEWQGRRETLIIKPQKLAFGERHRTAVSRTIRIPTAGAWRALIRCQVEYRTAHQNFAGGGPLYPDNLGGGNRGGYFVLTTYQRSTSTETDQAASRYDLYPGNTTYNLQQHAELEVSVTLAGGVWDVYLTYNRGAAPDTFRQVNIGRSNLKVEVVSN